MPQHMGAKTRTLALLTLLLLLTGGRAWAFDEDYRETINGTTLHFRVRGVDKNNPYLLVLHGGPGFSSHMLYAWGETLEPTLNVVYLDQRGCGEGQHYAIKPDATALPPELKDYTVKTLLADIEGVRKSLGVQRWWVLGHSWGGMLGLEYITAHSKQVLGWIDLDGVVSIPLVQSEILDSAEAKLHALAQSDDGAKKARGEKYLAQVQQLRGLKPDNPERLQGLYGLALGPAGLYYARPQMAFLSNVQVSAYLKKKGYNVPSSALYADEPAHALVVNDHFLTRDDTALLARVHVPSLIINGQQDGVITPHTAQIAHQGIAHSQLLLLDDCGHFPFFEQPEKTTSAILEFVHAHTKAKE